MPELNGETLKLMKESAAKALDANRNAPNWFEHDAAVQNFRAQCSPANVAALIAEYERLKGENDQLRRDRDSWRRTAERLEERRVGINRVV